MGSLERVAKAFQLYIHIDKATRRSRISSTLRKTKLDIKLMKSGYGLLVAVRRRLLAICCLYFVLCESFRNKHRANKSTYKVLLVCVITS